MSTTIIQKPEIEIAPSLLQQLKSLSQPEGQVIVHCLYQDVMPWGSAIRIWPSTFLMDHDSEHQSELVHAENITVYPEWTPCEPFSRIHFTLFFSGLPKECEMFDLEEFCSNSGGEFIVRDIPRNESDVYYIRII